jgi:predicted Zn finger-like uncharacterized protein
MDIQCPGCGQQYRIADELAGKQVRCKKCSGTIVVPGAKVEAPQWYFQKTGFAGDDTVGPLTVAQLKALMGKGELSPKTGMFHPQVTAGGWVALADTPLAAVFAAVEQQKQQEKKEARLAKEEARRQQAEEKEALRQKKLAEQQARREQEAQQRKAEERQQQLNVAGGSPPLVAEAGSVPVTTGFVTGTTATCWYCQLPNDLSTQQCVFCRMIN